MTTGQTIARNQHYSISEAQLRKLNELTEKRRAVDEAHRLLAQPGEKATDIKRRLNTQLMKALSLDATETSHVITEWNEKELAKGVIDLSNMPPQVWLPVVSAGHHFGPTPKEQPPAPPPDNTIWWLQTNWYHARAIQAEWVSDEVHFYGNSTYNGDNRIKFSVGLTADFAMPPSRLIPSTVGRWTSAPTIEIHGCGHAYTGFQWWMSAGDKWSKCFLYLRQSFFQILPSGYQLLGERIIPHTAILNDENLGGWHTVEMPGIVDMPRVDFSLADPGLELHAQLDVRFDIELEGASAMCFGSKDVPVSVRTHQWTPTPV